ncbi:MAG: DNA-directed RNA polymerase subunit beta' [Elusimicrobiota bacterium]|nr:DNA-directed RNA polymerase subunit beta' [Elusimicrobiota bacterium]
MKLSQKKIQSFDMLDFGAIRISLSSPEQIKEWSYGEVKKTETLNYKTLKPERDGLFCEKIFGPVKDYECTCGKYKKSPTTVTTTGYKRIECDRCGVEITSSKVRRERMGHITLAVPIAHFWYFGKAPCKIAILLDMGQEDVRKIVYGMLWVVVKDIDDIRDVIIRSLDEIKLELKLPEETYTELLTAVKSEKISLPKKLVLDTKRLSEYLKSKRFKFVKLLDQGKENLLTSLIKKVITAITDDEKYIGNLSDEKNYLRENVTVATNAEALYRLLKTTNDELENELKKIRENLKELSLAENTARINILFEKYKDFNVLSEDLQKITEISKHLKQVSKGNVVKEIEEGFKKIDDKIEIIRVVSKLRSELVKNVEKLPKEILDILFILFEKYNIAVQPSPLRSRLINRFKLIESFLVNNIKPEWMILQVLPVLPPDLRPLVAIEGGKFASSDLNELYRRIIHRNNRLRKFLSGQSEKGEKPTGVPKLILLNEKRLLQEAVDALIENSAKKHPVMSTQNRPLKSLTDILKGKQGRFRQNLLGKRIDYSGRSVIVVGPELKLYQCGLPKEMALELFKPFLLHKLMKKYGITLKKAKTILEVKKPTEIWDILEEITRHHPVLLNRAPTLHRPSIQAFEPVLVDGKAIRIHPMVCTPYNADFDGDQMAVYVPLTLESITETKLLMSSYFNLFSPANGKALIGPTQDVVLGIAYLTAVKAGVQGEGMIFSSVDEALHCYQQGLVDLNARIKVIGINSLEIREDKSGQKDYTIYKDPNKWEDYTTVGRLIFNSILPQKISLFNPSLTPAEKKRRNVQLGKKELVEIIKECYQKCGCYETVLFLDELKKLGYHYATVSGFTISVDDMKIPAQKNMLIEETWKKVKEIEKQSEQGIITEKERYNSIIDAWSEAIEKISNEMIEEMKKIAVEKYEHNKPRYNSVYFMAQSGARGNIDQVRQLSGIRGLMSRPQRKITGEIGEIIETPIISNFREGLSVLEYFISTHGGRKGLSDTALKTSEAGYLTRRLVDVAHHVVVTEEDCGTGNRIKVSALKIGDEVIESLSERIAGRVAADDITYEILDEKTGKIITKTIKSGEIISEEQALEIEKTGLYDSIRIRSVLTCEAKNGVCAKCYGMDLSTGELVKVGEAVGIIAAQSIGEPGTQLTLRTFHIGGAAARLTKQSQIKAPYDGVVEFMVEPHDKTDTTEVKKFKTIRKKDENGRTINIVLTSDAVIRFIYTDAKGEKRRESWPVSYGTRIYVEDGSDVKKGTLIADWDQYSIPIIAERYGRIKYRDLDENKTYVVEYRASGNVEKRVLPRKGKANPRLDVVNEKGKTVASYPLPVDSVILVNDGDEVNPGDVLAKIFKEEIKTKDITGGLPRVEELFEARHPSNPAVLSEIDGIVKIETSTAAEVLEQQDVQEEHREIKISIKVMNPKSKKEIKYEIPPGRIPLVYDGDRVEAGEPLTDGVIDPHKYLEIRGPQHLQEFLLNEVQQVYRLQGVNINDKHIEIIIRQMLSFVRITDPGLPPKPDPQRNKHFYEFIYGEIVPKKLFEEEINKINDEMRELKKAGRHSEAELIRPPKAEPVLLGITTVSSSSESFLSAASFQETSRVLTESALESKIDELSGLKENVILGRLIPAGTGLYAEETISLTKEVKPVEELMKL